jgi:hypothetical protein
MVSWTNEKSGNERDRERRVTYLDVREKVKKVKRGSRKVKIRAKSNQYVG